MHIHKTNAKLNQILLMCTKIIRLGGCKLKMSPFLLPYHSELRYFVKSICIFFHAVLCFISFNHLLLIFKYSCLCFPTTTSPPTLNPTPLWLCPWVLYTHSLTTLSLLSPIISLPPPLWLLSVCSLFLCLWLYFVCLSC